MKVRHFLSTIEAIVSNQTVAAVLKPFDLDHLQDRAIKRCQLCIAGFGGEVSHGNILALGNHQRVHRGVRIDIFKGQRVDVFMNLLTRDFAAQYFCENILIVVSHAGFLSAAGFLSRFFNGQTRRAEAFFKFFPHECGFYAPVSPQHQQVINHIGTLADEALLTF